MKLYIKLCTYVYINFYILCIYNFDHICTIYFSLQFLSDHSQLHIFFPFIIHRVIRAASIVHGYKAIQGSMGYTAGHTSEGNWHSLPHLPSHANSSQLVVRPVSPLPDRSSHDLILHRSCAGSHSIWEFMSAVALLCPT